MNFNVYLIGRRFLKVGVILCEDMFFEMVYVKFGWVFGYMDDFKEVRRMMLINYVGEIMFYMRFDIFLR